MLPWEYGVRNLSRRPLRTVLTLGALSVVVTLVFVVVGFIGGLEKSLSISGDPDVVLVYSVNSQENIENSAIAATTASLLSASLSGIEKRHGAEYVSAELFLGTQVKTTSLASNDLALNDLASNDLALNQQAVPQSVDTGFGLVRGVTTGAPLVRRTVKLFAGNWPGPGEVMVGRLAATKMGCPAEALTIGNRVEFEGRQWTISGQFSAGGAAFESELWCNLSDFQTATQRQDLSLVALRMAAGNSSSEVDLFCKIRTDLELKAISETGYYQSLQQHYRPVRILAWVVVVLVAAAGVFAGLNMMYGAVAGRVREIATLQALGFQRWAVLASIVQEGVLLSATASLIAGAFALIVINGLAVRFTMGAFTLQIDSFAILIGFSTGLLLGVLGALPPALKALQAPVATSLKAI